MIRICIVGDIGSGKSHVARSFGFPVFNADLEVGELYKKNRKIFNKLNKILPNYIYSFPVNKNEMSKAILANKFNLKKIVKIVHREVKKKMNIFLKDNKKKDAVILDIPLLLENRLNQKGDIIIFIQSNKTEVIKRLKKRTNFNLDLLNKFKKIQLPLSYKKKKSNFIIKNNFNNSSVKTAIRKIIKKIL